MFTKVDSILYYKDNLIYGGGTWLNARNWEAVVDGSL